MDWFLPAEDRIYELARRLLSEFMAARPEYGQDWILGRSITCQGSFLLRTWRPWQIPAEARGFCYSQTGARDGKGGCSLSNEGGAWSSISLNYEDEPTQLDAQFVAWISGALRNLDSGFCFTAEDDRIFELARRMLTEYVEQRPRYRPELAFDTFSSGSRQTRSLRVQSQADQATIFSFSQYKTRGTSENAGRCGIFVTTGKLTELDLDYEEEPVPLDGKFEAWLSEALRKLG